MAFYDYFHGVQVDESADEKTQIQGPSRSVIGIIGTAEGGEAKEDEPVLITKPTDIEKYFGEASAKHTLVRSLHAIFLNASAKVVAVRVKESTDPKSYAGTASNVKGVFAFLKAGSTVGYVPKILIAPDLSHDASVITSFKAVAAKLRAVALIDCEPKHTNKDAIRIAKSHNSSRLILCSPRVNGVGDIGEIGMSAFSAGVMAKNDASNGYYTSPSNKPVNGIESLCKPIDWSLSDENSEANLLNKDQVQTIIRHNGFRLWGSRTLGKSNKEDIANEFINVRRITDSINDAVQESMLVNVDENISKALIQNVVESVNAFLRDLKSKGAIINGKCFVDSSISETDLKQGKINFDFDYTAPRPAEQIRFRSIITDKYMKEVFK